LSRGPLMQIQRGMKGPRHKIRVNRLARVYERQVHRFGFRPWRSSIGPGDRLARNWNGAGVSARELYRTNRDCGLLWGV